MTTEFPLSTMIRLAKKSGVRRVNVDAAKLLGKILEDVGQQICREAMMSMMLAKRVTLQPEDVDLAAKKFMSNLNKGRRQ